MPLPAADKSCGSLRLPMSLAGRLRRSRRAAGRLGRALATEYSRLPGTRRKLVRVKHLPNAETHTERRRQLAPYSWSFSASCNTLHQIMYVCMHVDYFGALIMNICHHFYVKWLELGRPFKQNKSFFFTRCFVNFRRKGCHLHCSVCRDLHNTKFGQNITQR